MMMRKIFILVCITLLLAVVGWEAFLLLPRLNKQELMVPDSPAKLGQTASPVPSGPGVLIARTLVNEYSGTLEIPLQADSSCALSFTIRGNADASQVFCLSDKEKDKVIITNVKQNSGDENPLALTAVAGHPVQVTERRNSANGHNDLLLISIVDLTNVQN